MPPTSSPVPPTRSCAVRPTDRPWFLYFAPNAPHTPWIPADRYRDASTGVSPPMPSLAQMNDVRGKPGYVTSRPPLTAPQVEAFRQDDLRERAMLRSVDDAIRSLVDAIAARGELDRTVIVFLTDNGYEFGLHRLEGKRYPYEPSIGLPFAIRAPWSVARTDPTLVANVDLASTISELAQVRPELPQDGISLVPALEGRPIAARPGVWLDWGGDENVSGVVRRPDGRLHLRSERRRNRGALPTTPMTHCSSGTWPRIRGSARVLDRLERLTDSLAAPEGGR